VIDAYRKQEPVRNLIIDPANSGEKTSIMAIPILLRGQILGVLTVKIQREAIADDLVEFLRSVTERLSVALENVRLLEEIQSNAERDHLVADISGRVRSATGVDQILRTAAEELGRTLGLSDVLVQLRPTDPTPTREGANQ
jgi:GAF domain-containing protein